MVDAPKNAVPVGTVAGIQLAAVLKSELAGAVDQVASWAWAGIAASKAAAVVSKCVRIAPPPLRNFSTQWPAYPRLCGVRGNGLRVRDDDYFAAVVFPQHLARGCLLMAPSSG